MVTYSPLDSASMTTRSRGRRSDLLYMQVPNIKNETTVLTLNPISKPMAKNMKNNRNSLQRPPWRQKKVAVVKRWPL